MIVTPIAPDPKRDAAAALLARHGTVAEGHAHPPARRLRAGHDLLPRAVAQPDRPVATSPTPWPASAATTRRTARSAPTSAPWSSSRPA